VSPRRPRVRPGKALAPYLLSLPAGLWLLVLFICWPLALLALVLYPIAWLLLLPFLILFVVGYWYTGLLSLLQGRFERLTWHGEPQTAKPYPAVGF